MIALLAPVFSGEWAPYGETLACGGAPPEAARPVSDLVDDPHWLGRLLDRHGRVLGGGDPRAVASAWSMAYLHALLPPVVAALGLLQQAIPCGAADMRVAFDTGGRPVRFHIAGLGHPSPGTGTPARFSPLLHGHLQPLFTALARQSRLPEKVLWSNAARDVALILDHLLDAHRDRPGLADDRRHLLDRPVWPDGRANPLGAVPRHGPQRALRHRHCCLYHLLPGRSHCPACPLARDAGAGC